jgi:hypothetical protein
VRLSDDQEPVTGFATLMDLYRGWKSEPIRVGVAHAWWRGRKRLSASYALVRGLYSNPVTDLYPVDG